MPLLDRLYRWLNPPDDRLVRAASRGDRAGVEAALTDGADINAAPGRSGGGGDTPLAERGATALHEAAKRGDSALVEWLLDRGARPCPTDVPWNKTPAHRAAEGGHADAYWAIVRRYPEAAGARDRMEHTAEQTLALHANPVRRAQETEKRLDAALPDPPSVRTRPRNRM